MVQIVEHALKAAGLVGDGVRRTHRDVAGGGAVLECLTEAADDGQRRAQVVADVGQGDVEEVNLIEKNQIEM